MLKIHGVPISVHTRKVILAALEKNLEFANEPVIPFQPPAGWDRLSPTGKIPVAQYGELLLRDSSVICAYLERLHPEPALYPADAEGYAQACGSKSTPTARCFARSCTACSTRRSFGRRS